MNNIITDQFIQEKTYWSGNGKYEVLIKNLQKLVPDNGTVKNPKKNRKLEKFRKAQNCYYDLYNNGLCNRASEFARMFEIASSMYKQTGRYGSEFSIIFYRKVEEKMNEIILEAGIEQGLI